MKTLLLVSALFCTSTFAATIDEVVNKACEGHLSGDSVFSAEGVAALLPVLASHPDQAVQLLQMLPSDLPPTAKATLFQNFQVHLAGELGSFLKPLRLSSPETVRAFEAAVLAKFYSLQADDEHLNRLLSSVGVISLPPSGLHLALAEMMFDAKPDVSAHMMGVLKRTARVYGIPPNLEQALLQSKSSNALEVLALSRKTLNDETYLEMLARFSEIQDQRVFETVSSTLLEKPVWRERTLSALQSLRSNDDAMSLTRVIAARDLIEARVDAQASEKFLLRLIPSLFYDERGVLMSWCINSPRTCPASIRSALFDTQVAQTHQASN